MMPLSKILFLGIVLYLLYRFVFNFLVPVVRTTRQVRRSFQHMQDQARSFQETGSAQPGPQPQRGPEPQPRPKSNSDKMGEYIDFEEVK